MADETFAIIVEGKNDRSRLQAVLPPEIPIIPTFGIPNQDRLERIRKAVKHHTVVIFTDADAAGRRIRRILREAFPDALNVYTKPGYNGVEHTPVDYIMERFKRLGILEWD
ncbi:toprim domain-containing protein [Sulfobacillus thermosulfidooxidans]|uniref:Toprim domain protein n=2 Tax=Sulfobacillus thermosulfidooxidans TaxID=28034 RepID=A0A1W1WLW2_SULTA|nr:toprim domain-containing protein [Sulfobacillus thermosulfidooxidans]OLZ09617.1 topoisomerase [Sulfobacillus thermosulfidooxidans]OLZ16077.1 topoisomerase [Sulfobacillus thermosulfidooxidans]OLZ18075.1 topoisomerase [Sulfobacillus thermosulfidooxidans]PSR29819.1 MAG: topoisomerase [Sulfobacillus thermosulfidooxidans]SMC07246.1 toprim domain protein [Sulfobacillus thermosulfidooxidans DSM 9293]